MKIALYYPWVYLKSGVEKTILETVKRSRHQYTIFTNHYDSNGTYPEFKKYKVVELKKIPVNRTILSVIKATIIISFQKINLEGFDLLLVHSEGLGDLILTRNNTIPAVCFCHTPLRAVFDREYKIRALQARGFVGKRIYAFLSFAFTRVDSYLWSKYTHVFFNSRETLRRAQEGDLLRSLKGRYEILHPGVNVQKISPIYKPYFLIPGRIMWTKNIELAIRSFIRFKRTAPKQQNFRLVISGQVDTKSRFYVKNLLEITQKRKDITIITSPSEKKLRKLYSECWAVLLTSFNEDWGLTLLEGNSFGKPSITVSAGGPKESQVDGVTGFVTNANTQDLSQKMTLLARNEKLTRKLGKHAYRNAKQYSWNHFVRRIDQVLTESRQKP